MSSPSPSRSDLHHHHQNLLDNRDLLNHNPNHTAHHHQLLDSQQHSQHQQHHHHQQQQQHHPQQQQHQQPHAQHHHPSHQAYHHHHAPQYPFAPGPSSSSSSSLSLAVPPITSPSSLIVPSPNSSSPSAPATSPGLVSLNASRYNAPLPALHDHSPRYDPASTTGFDSTGVTSQQPSSSYVPFSNGFQQSSYSPAPTSSSFSYSLTSTDGRPRIPSIHSPKPMMAPHNRSTSGGTKSVSPSLGGSSVRADYATSTPGLSRHAHLPSRPSQNDMLTSPHSPMSPAVTVSPSIGSLASPGLDPSNGGLGSTTNAGPPLGDTQVLHQLSAADGILIRPEINARVDKGFFLSDRDWTCYRRNYFSVICSYSLSPGTHSMPLYLRRSSNSAPEPILAFAMCISATVDPIPSGKTVELVQHTPKRDKGPQQKPAKIKLSAQPATGLSFGGGPAGGVIQQSQPGSLDHDYHGYGQQPPTQPSQQHIAVFDRIQFKSATANNGKRRAAQQYYHLMVELYAEVGGSVQGSMGNPDANWVKVAYKTSAPMVVRGRSPGHYADGQRSTSNPGGGGTAGGNQSGGSHPPAHNASGPQGYQMDNSGMGPTNHGGPSSGMHQHVASPPTSSAHHSNPTHAGSPPTHYVTTDPAIDPELNAEPAPISGQYQSEYTMIPNTYYEPHHQGASMPPPPSVDSGYDSPYANPRKSEQPLETGSQKFESDPSAYVPQESYAKGGLVKEEYGSQSGQQHGGAWLGSGAINGAGKTDQRYSSQSLYPNKCGTFETSNSTKNWFPNISSI